MSDPVAPDSTASDKPVETEQLTSRSERPERAERPFEREATPFEREATPERAVAPERPKIGDSRPAPVARPVERETRPKIGDTRVPRVASSSTDDAASIGEARGDAPRRRRRRGGRGRGGGGGQGTGDRGAGDRSGGGSSPTPVEARRVDDDPIQLDEKTLKRRRGRERKGRPVGRYMMCVSVRPNVTQIAVLEGRSLVEHYVSRPADETTEIHGNIYLGRVQNVLPGME